MTYGLIFWGNSSHADMVFKLQKRVIRVMKGCGYRESCRNLFKELNILSLKSQYIFSLMMFVIKNRDYFAKNKDCHGVNTRQNINLHTFQVNLTIYGKGVYHTEVKLKEISNNPRKFKSELKEFIHLNSFYTLREFFNRLIYEEFVKLLKLFYKTSPMRVDFIQTYMTCSISRMMHLKWILWNVQ
jgi:hypothetical protein